MTTETDKSTDATDNINLDGLTELATLVGAAQDALTDDMVTRLSSVFSEGITLLDRLVRNEGVVHLLRELDRPENQHFLISLSNAITAASQDLATAPPAKGGVIGLYKLGCDPGTQEGLRMVSLICARLSESMREMHRHGS
ncbi:MAG: hypothetical protein COA54_06600 [Thiotrichaceae bacterium]|nr:MAG: hypothetical protein COA54_06600 [Thiotrichaceae bacterium]